MATYSLITRETKGSKLTIEEMDGNLLYLQQLAISGITGSGSQGPQGPQGYNGLDGNTGVQGVNGRNGDVYYATSSTYLSVPDIGYVVNIQVPTNLSYTLGQTIIVANTVDSYYADVDYDDDDYESGYFEGQIEWYDKISGTMSIVTTLSSGVGNTYSFWYINLSGAVGKGLTGPQGPAGPTGNGGSGNLGATGSQGSIQYNNNGVLSGTAGFYWDELTLSIYNGSDDDALRVGQDFDSGYIYVNSNGSSGNMGFWSDEHGDGNLNFSGSITKGTPGVTNSSNEIATTEFVYNAISRIDNLFTSSFYGTTLNTGVFSYSSTYSILLTSSASLNDISFNGYYSGNSAATYSVEITNLNSYILLVETTDIPYQLGEILQGNNTGTTASLVFLISGSENVLVIDGTQDFSGDSRIIGLSSGANAAYDSLRVSDLFTYAEIGGSQSNGTGICQISFDDISTNVGNELSVHFTNNVGHSLGDTWVYNILPTSTNPLTVNSMLGESFKIDSQGDVIINQVTYEFPNSQGITNSVLTNNGDGSLSWNIPTPRTADFVALSVSGGVDGTASSVCGLAIKYPYTSYSRGISLDGGDSGFIITLNGSSSVGKLYQIYLSFFIYNIFEPTSYRLKLNGSYIGLEMDLYQNSNNDSLRMISITEIVAIDTSSTLEFWRTTDNTVNPAVQGTLNIIEII